MKTTIAALMMAVALTACNKSGDNAPPSSGSGATSQSGAAPAGLGGLGGNTKTK
ncbi:hypothetical protein [Bordetella genomosp. 11]|uniref:hypothetical protein n=1 Tax=Bordetella genomosp. 11 TaxID=1416808 RepID=UPI001595EFC3|nr:hypothetical protein [Bordetella genomosp. 11]